MSYLSVYPLLTRAWPAPSAISCQTKHLSVNSSYGLPASVAQLDAPSYWRPGGRGFNPRRGRQHSFVEIDHEIFSTVILSLPLIQEEQLSVSGERMCTILVNRLEDCPVNVWLGELTALNMTPLGWLGRKTSTQTNNPAMALVDAWFGVCSGSSTDNPRYTDTRYNDIFVIMTISKPSLYR